MAAPRPLPTWTGPVGLAETYSTWVLLPWPMSSEGHDSPVSAMTRVCPAAHAGMEVEVEEAGRRDADLGDSGVRGHTRSQRLGHVERLHAREALDPERQVGGEVPVLGALRVLEC